MIEKLGASPEEVLQVVVKRTRDRCRSPLQWSDAPNGGFCPPGVEPWLPVNPNYAAGINVASQDNDPTSLLTFYRRMLHLRRTTPALIAGNYKALHPQSEAYLAFIRGGADLGQSCLVLLNFSPEEQTVAFDLNGMQPRLLFSSRTRSDQPLALDRLTIAPYEVFVAELM